MIGRLLAGLILVAAFSQVMPAKAAEPLVDSQWLRQNLGRPGLVVLDVTSNKYAYAAGHIPGAVFTHYVKDKWRVARTLSGKKVKGLLPDTAHLERLIGGLGIGNDDHVILVANGTSPGDMGVATRIYWTFKVLGHDEVSILNGGMAAYRADKRNPLEKTPVRPSPKTFKAEFRAELIATTEEVGQALAGGTPLIDSRPPDQHLGINKSGSVRRYGTLPNALNVPAVWTTVDAKGMFRSAESLRKLYAMMQAAPESEAITFCNTGHWASVGWFVHSELLGNRRTAMYDGSMAEWTVDPANQVRRKASLD